MSGDPAPKRRKLSLTLSKTGKSSPSKAASTPSPSPKKFSPRKYYAPRRFSPKKQARGKTSEAGVGASTSGSEGPSELNSGPAGSDVAEKRSQNEGYYCANFKEVLSKSLLSANPERHVITEQEVALVEEFMQLEVPHQQLYVRLFLRKHQWLRSSKISYNDIAPDLSPILGALHDKKFLLNEADLKDPSMVLTLLQLSELKSLCKQLHMPAAVVASSKAKMIQALFKQDRDHRPLFGRAQFMSSVVKRGKELLCGCVRLSQEPLETFSKIMLLFSVTNAWLNRDEDNDFSQVIFRMLQVNVGQLVYPQYEILITKSLFRDKESFDNYYRALKEEQSLQQALEEAEHNTTDRILKSARQGLQDDVDSRGTEMDSSTPPFFLPFTRGHVYVRVLSRGVEYLEKSTKYQEANQVLEQLLTQGTYSCRRRGRWWDRLALNWDFHLKDKAKCLEVIETALQDPHLTPALRLSLVQRARRILQSKSVKKRKLFETEANSSSSSCGVRAEGRGGGVEGRDGGGVGRFSLEQFPELELLQAPEKKMSPSKSEHLPTPMVCIDGKQLYAASKPFFVPRPKPGDTRPSQQNHTLLGVEGYALEHYLKEKGWPCALHSENSAFSTLFGVLMWDVLFANVADVFRAPFQNAPLDLFSDSFYSSREELIETRLDQISTASEEELSKLTAESWEDHFGQVCVGVDWKLFPGDVRDAKDVVVCLGGELLSKVCRLYCKSYRASCSGLPDLFLWDTHKKLSKFVEVKGPGDKLSAKQMVWLSRLASWGCEVEVCRVRAYK